MNIYVDPTLLIDEKIIYTIINKLVTPNLILSNVLSLQFVSYSYYTLSLNDLSAFKVLIRTLINQSTTVSVFVYNKIMKQIYIFLHTYN